MHGIEIGHVFKLGTKYSVSLEAEYKDEKEQRHPIIMGCYGIGVNRIIASLCETRHDANGIIWPLSIAPYEVILIPLNYEDAQVRELTDKAYNELKAQGVDVLMDDRDQRPGFKFKDADLIGIPLRLVIGGKGLKEGNVEVKWRWQESADKVPVEQAVSTVLERLAQQRAEEAKKVPV